MNTPSISAYVEHHTLWGKNNDTKKGEKAFMKSALNQWSKSTTSDQITNIYSTLGIIERALYEFFEENDSETGTWTRRFEKGQAVVNKGCYTYQLTIQKDQIAAAFSKLFYMLQHNWQRSNRNECEQIMNA